MLKQKYILRYILYIRFLRIYIKEKRFLRYILKKRKILILFLNIKRKERITMYNNIKKDDQNIYTSFLNEINDIFYIDN